MAQTNLDRRVHFPSENHEVIKSFMVHNGLANQGSFNA